MDRLAAAVTARGAAVVARVDHAAAAAAVGLALAPTEVLIFGNPRAGTPLMQARANDRHRSAAAGAGLARRLRETFVGYNDPHWLARRHGAEVGNEADPEGDGRFARRGRRRSGGLKPGGVQADEKYDILNVNSGGRG